MLGIRSCFRDLSFEQHPRPLKGARKPKIDVSGTMQRLASDLKFRFQQRRSARSSRLPKSASFDSLNSFAVRVPYIASSECLISQIRNRWLAHCKSRALGSSKNPSMETHMAMCHLRHALKHERGHIWKREQHGMIGVSGGPLRAKGSLGPRGALKGPGPRPFNSNTKALDF